MPVAAKVPLQSVPQPAETLSQLIWSVPCIFWSPIA